MVRNTTINRGLNGLHPLSYMGDNPTTPPDFYSINRDPGPTDWQDFTLCDYWLNTLTQDVWVLVSLNNNIAKWVKFAGGNGSVLSLTGNTGGPVFPLAGNINVIGDGVGITIAGNPGTHTLTASLVGGGQAAQSFVTDSGTATPIAGVIDLFAQPQAGSSIKFSASTNVIRLNTTDGLGNTIIGLSAGNTTLTAVNSVGLGINVLHSLTTADGCTAMGAAALSNCTTAMANTAIGGAALFALTTGSGSNVAVGTSAGQQLTTGSRNTAVGYGALNNTTPGNGPFTCAEVIALGAGAGSAYTGAESDNILVGNLGQNGENNTIRIGLDGSGTAQQNRCFVAGIRGITTGVNDAIAVLIDSAGQLGTVSSSKRYKKNIKDMGIMSENIMGLRPVIFNYKHSDQLSWGLIAEEVEEVFPNLVIYNSEGLPETVKYHDLVPMLLNELQKLAERVEELESQ